jgi:predicted Zn-dependent peptidase
MTDPTADHTHAGVPVDRPAVARPTPWAFPAPVDTILANGLRLIVVDRPGQHMVACALSLDLPLTAEPRAQEGIAALVQRTLDEGTSAHPGTSFSEELEGLGASLDGHVSQAQSVLTLSVPVSRLPGALALLAEAVTTPEFSPADVERHRRLRLAEIAQVGAQPAQRAEVMFRHHVLRPGARHGRLAGGGEATVATITPDDVRRFHALHYRPAGATMVLAGDFGGHDPRSLVENAFGDWNGEPPQQEHEHLLAGEPVALVVDRPGAVQADVRYGGFSIDRTDDRWAPLRVATHAVGGEFLSRLNRVLREERGYTYGVSMAHRALRRGGYYAVRGSFRNDAVAPALTLARDLLSVDAFTSGEISSAIDFFAGSTALRFSTAGGLMSEVVAALGAGLDYTSIDALIASVTQVTPATALDAYGSVVTPDPRWLVVVGAADEIAQPLEDAGWGVDILPADTPLP